MAIKHKEMLEKNPEDFRLMKISEAKAMFLKLNNKLPQLIAEDNARFENNMKNQTPEFFKQQIS